ncbi:hypothetical protein KEM09_02305 [Carboxylicivirga mesophila]|uniref:Oligosaccharide repeat unit polymerase n=1 Tax=Carboxylicivirga mesophila TaxID=1166478 RepID=A0ABS5K775_9BACT|nr:hypothetical protein [Carboxylicivirga mesophila]MBS2210213.1 hypothetical protein [Carboxylicivirga mesophila]
MWILPLCSISVLYGYLNGYNNLSNISLSIIYLGSLLLIIFSSPKSNPLTINVTQLKKVEKVSISILLGILILNNILGIIQFVFNPFNHYPRDDAFIGIYGRHGVAQHGLAILNGFFVMYYMIKIFNGSKKSVIDIGYLIFFLISHVLCFYGLGFLMLLCVIFIYIVYKYISFKNVIRIILGGICGLYMFAYFFSGVYDYMAENINYLFRLLGDVDYDAVYIPGKIRVWMAYFDEYINGNLGLFLFGTGPGGFNSRVSFLLNADSSNLLVKVLGNSMPHLHKEVIHPIWDMSVISMDKYNDGTRNQPFSSIVALLSEYGVIFTVILFRLLYLEIKRIANKVNNSTLKDFICLGSIYVFINMILDNFFEFSECWAFFLFLFFIKINIIIKENESAIYP